MSEFVMRVISVSTGGGLSINKKQVPLPLDSTKQTFLLTQLKIADILWRFHILWTHYDTSHQLPCHQRV
jgi:hypothetical protein